jgi:quercetin dioxygenase-like cupin family protein
MDEKKRSGAPLRPLEAQVLQFAVLGEMTGLLQRLRANKSKRAASALVKSGPIRVDVIALDEGVVLENQKVDGPFTVQCLLGRAKLSVQGRDEQMTTGDLVVVDHAVAHDVRAEEASVLLFTVAAVEG